MRQCTYEGTKTITWTEIYTDSNGNTYTALLIDGIPVHRITADNITESEVQLTAVRKEYYNKRANAI